MAGEGGRLYINSMVDTAGDKKVIMVNKKAESSKKDELPEYGGVSKESEEDQAKKEEAAWRSKYSMSDADLAKLRRISHVQTVTPAYSTDGMAYAQSSGNGKKFVLEIAVDRKSVV